MSAPKDALLEHLTSAIKDDFSDTVGTYFEDFEGDTLLKLEWSKKREPKHFELRVEDYQSEARILELAFVTGQGKSTRSISVEDFTRESPNWISIKFNLSGKTVTHDLLEEEYFQLDEDESGESARVTYSRETPCNFQIGELPEYEEFARTFLSKNDDSDAQYYRINPEINSGENAFHDALSLLGLNFESGATWVRDTPETEFDIRLPEDENGEYDFPEPDEITLEFNNKSNITFGEFVAKIALLQIALRTALYLYGGEVFADRLPEEFNFLSESDFAIPRPIDLDPNEVASKLEDNSYYFPWHVINSACTSLNAGKHVIFTGPPGCGKSKLAIELARMASEEDSDPVVATASPAWSTNDVIGRYLPRRGGRGLEFEPGLFLRASQDQRWLVIDELNRADIDGAFGELFSVLAGDTAELPYREYEDGDIDTESDEFGEEVEESPDAKRVRIVPFGASGSDDPEDNFSDYHVSQRFRLLATMNDADRSKLHQLSFALQRRFNIIRIEAPEVERIRKLIQHEIDELAPQYEISCKSDESNAHSYGIKWEGGHHDWLYLDDNDAVTEKLHALFANQSGLEADEWEHDFQDLVRERIAGISAVIDTIKFLAEAMRAPDEDQTTVMVERDSIDNKREAGRELIRSYIAMALSLNVVPQFEALTGERDELFKAIEFCLHVFYDSAEDELDPFRRVERQAGNNEFKGDRYELVENGTINDYLAREIALQLGRGGMRQYESKWRELAEDKELISDIPNVT